MPFYPTHLTVLQTAAILHPSANAFRVPEVETGTNTIRSWRAITYSQFLRDVEHTAAYWTEVLTAEGVHPPSVVGLWLSGMTYVDALHIYGISRAGYVPQLMSLRLPNPDVILELLEQSGGRALIYDTSFSAVVRPGSVPMHVAVDPRDITVSDVPLPPIEEGSRSEDPVMIFHTSGSTSGRPKLVPCSHSWWANMMAKAATVLRPKRSQPDARDVFVWMGSLCHMAQAFMLVGTLQHGSCMVQSTQQAYPTEEFLDMVNRCGVTRVNIFPPLLAVHLRNSRKDPVVLAALQGLDQILIAGLTMSQEDQQWVQSQGIKVLDCYASTEVAIMMTSDRGVEGNRLPPLRPNSGGSYKFMPIIPAAAASESGYQNIHAHLVELIVLADSPDCPDVSLRHADGDYHTGDLFLEVAPGGYVFCGRDDDWIKSENSLRCDTKAIEDNVRIVCDDLVSNCVVVGNGRPTPALFVEPARDGDAQKLRQEIFRRIRPFHARRYLHERVASADSIFVVDRGVLPRTATKGNIRRRAVEQAFKAELDRLFGVVH
ncbi:acetyl-CoA synthetase-like protein [Rhodofomes roseus]|uniref:Acetyl-CoA synthetase-like protein n=1 Tax=Rhodofomes roseus TaxID=34475 RepID=A0ABQ8KH54_9APHY|nr:acetyl-CoA synthetase-like protein [Rhodofomes roseus]KAH9837074.1 acetyl-CoA synthetase-like protein [Rhodofomes roseus]